MKLVRDNLLYLCNGDQPAADFILQLWNFGVVWDNAIDRDKTKDAGVINDAMMWALFGLHDSPFYRKHEAALRPAIMLAIGSWIVANKFEKSRDPVKVEQAYFMRCAPYDVFATVVLLVAGFQKHLEAIEFFRGAAPEDSLANYKLEHCHGLDG